MEWNALFAGIKGLFSFRSATAGLKKRHAQSARKNDVTKRPTIQK
jgi:hypothetical protein